jgi:dTDP-4-amino-4,6-dideoxygalactose transaminase
MARTYGFLVLEDAAHSIGSTYTHGGDVFECGSCAHSDMAIFSFHPVKTITTGEGGAILTNNDELASRLRMFRAHGIERSPERMTRCDGPWYYEMQSLGYNYRITDFQCALGLSQLRQLDEFKSRRAAIGRTYREIFSHDERLIMPAAPPHASPCYHLFPIQFTEGAARRLDMYNHLISRGIQTQVHYVPVYWHPYYKNRYGYQEGKCPAAERYYAGCLSLPLYPSMSQRDVEFVVECVLEGMTRTLEIPSKSRVFAS